MTHSADTEAEFELLHPADRLMIRLIQLPHIADRVKGMLFQVRFGQNIELLKQVCLVGRGVSVAINVVQSLELLLSACADLANAKLFRQLLNIILMMGNYLNGTNYAGGAYGFKIASINRVLSARCSSVGH